MPRPDLAVVSSRVVTGGAVRPAAVHVSGGRITAVTAPGEVRPGTPVEDHGDLVVTAGLVDSHVHVNEPGRTEWEGFATATRAARLGGTTTIVDMPLNSVPPTTTVANLEAKRRAAAGRCEVDVAFWGGIVPDNAGDLEGLAASGVRGFKAFLVESGVPEFPPVDADHLRKVLPVLADAGLPLLVHAEDPGAIGPVTGDPRDHRAWLASRPAAAEDAAVATLARLAEETGARIHVLHLSSAGALPVVRDSPLTAETCPHYLALAAEEVPPGATAYKCAPPIREAENRERLWEGLRDGTIAMVVSDHSPCPAELKAGDFASAWGGIASLQLRLPLVWTEARRRGVDLPTLARWLAEAPAALAGLPAKGRIEPGADADLAVWDPDATATVDPAALAHRHPVTPYAGRELAGIVVATSVASGGALR